MPLITRVSRASLNSFTRLVEQNGQTFENNSTGYTEITFTYGVGGKGGPVPNWKSKLANGISASTSLTAQGYTFRPGHTSIDMQWKGIMTSTTDKASRLYRLTGYVPIQEPPSGPQISDAGADSQAVALFIRKARDAQSSFNGGTFLGEIREAIQLFRPKSWSLVKSMKDDYLPSIEKIGSKFSKRQPRRHRVGNLLRDKKRAIADQWLEYSFGIKPLVSDIDDAAKELARLNNFKPKSKGIQAGYSSRTVLGPYGVSVGLGGCDLVGQSKTICVVDVRYKGAVRVTFGNSASNGYKNVRSSLGLTMDQFVPTLWELIPYSFMVDYFTNVGDIISALSFPVGSLTYAVRGSKWQNKATSYLVSKTTQPSDEFWIRSGSGSLGVTTIERYGLQRSDALNGMLVPSLAFHMPFSNSQYLNMGALALAHGSSRKSLRR
jgi:hypothetical protein